MPAGDPRVSNHQPADDIVATKVSLVVVDMNEALEQLLNLCLHSGNYAVVGSKPEKRSLI